MRAWFDHIWFHIHAQGEAPALATEDRVVTYAMLGAAIEGCARRIAGLGVPRNGVVGVLVRDRIRHMALCLALHRLGLKSLSLADGAQLGGVVALDAIVADKDSPRQGLTCPVTEAADSWFAGERPGPAFPAGFAQASDICRLSLTSGSTGQPKCVAYSVAELGARMAEKQIGVVDASRTGVLCMPGLTANFGYTSACATLMAGRTAFFAQSPHQAIRMIDLYAIDAAIAAPEQLLALTRVARGADAPLRSLRLAMISGGVPTRALLEAATRYLCRDIRCRYGASETGAVAQANGRDVLLSPGLAGLVLPGIEVRIADAQGRPCAAGQPGRIEVRRRDEQESGASSARWIDVGDIGWLAADGRLYMRGREADVRETAVPGEPPAPQVSPVHEIESLVRLEWDMADAAAVLVEPQPGAPAEIWVGVAGQGAANAERVMTLARSNGLSQPVRLFHIDSVPRGANGKVRRSALKAALMSIAERSDARRP